MSGLAIQSPIFLPPTPAAAPAMGTADGVMLASEATAGTAGSGGVGALDTLDLSALAKALEKLAQAPGFDEQWLAKIMTLAQNQGEMLQFLNALNTPGGGDGVPAQFAEALQALGALGGATGEGRADGAAGASGAAGGSTGPDSGGLGAGREMFQEFQNKVGQAAGQALLSFVASVKASLGSLVLPPASEATMTATAVPVGGAPATAASAEAGTPGPAPAANSAGSVGNVAEFKAGLAQFVQAQVAQVTDLFRTIGAQLPGLGAFTGGAVELVENAPAGSIASVETPGLALAQPGADPAATELAGALRQLAAVGKLLASPLLRQDYINATLGRVSTLLSEPALAEALRRPAPALNPPPASAATPAPGTAAAASVPDPQRLAEGLGALLNQLTPLPASAAGESLPLTLPLAGGPTQLGLPEAGMPGVNAQSPERLAEMLRQGTRLAAVALDTPDRPPQATTSTPHEMGGKTPTRPGDPARTAPGRITAQGEEKKSDALPAARGGAHEKLKGTTAGNPTQNNSANGTAAEPRARVAQDLFTALLFSGGEGREAPGPDQPRDPAAARTRLEQYSHPEAFRPSPQLHQAPVTVQLAAFFQSHREEALTGQPFEASADEQAAPARLLLEYKPIEILRPGRSTPAGAQAADSQPSPPPVIDVQPLAVHRRS